MTNLPGDYDFEPGMLPPDAFSYSTLMARHKLTKAQAKRLVRRLKDERVFISPAFQANLIAFLAPPPLGSGTWISMKRLDKEPIVDRAVLARVMRALLPGNHGYELFPTQARVVDTANQFHLWTFAGQSVVDSVSVGPTSRRGEFEVCELAGLPREFPPVMAARVADRDEGDWRRLQAMKEAAFPDCDAVLFHSAQGDHPLEGQLLVMPDPQYCWPLGWGKGLTVDEGDERLGLAKQRPLGR